MKMAASVEEYIESKDTFAGGLVLLRDIMTSTELQETVKWGIPTYAINNKNVVSISAFKNHFGVWFFNGVFLSDPLHILINAQEGKTKGLRQLRFTNANEIDKKIILKYVLEAIDNQKKGLEIKQKQKKLVIPVELASILNDNEKLASIFESLTLGKKRVFAAYVGGAIRKETKIKRLEKIIPMILNNIGLNDKYR